MTLEILNPNKSISLEKDKQYFIYVIIIMYKEDKYKVGSA